MDKRTANYEGMFLIGQAAAADFGGAVDHVKQILAKAGAQIIAMKKWDERRLAYEIDKQKRGIYILVYFSCDTSHLAQIERLCNLSEIVMRQLVTKADHLTIEEMKAADGQKELEVEAKMRASQPQQAPKAEPKDEAEDNTSDDEDADVEAEANA